MKSLNYQLRKIIKNRGNFPNDEAVIKLLRLAICTIEDNEPGTAIRKPASAATLNAKPTGTSSKADHQLELAALLRPQPGRDHSHACGADWLRAPAANRLAIAWSASGFCRFLPARTIRPSARQSFLRPKRTAKWPLEARASICLRWVC
jgi:hypothetical protein